MLNLLCALLLKVIIIMMMKVVIMIIIIINVTGTTRTTTNNNNHTDKMRKLLHVTRCRLFSIAMANLESHMTPLPKYIVP